MRDQLRALAKLSEIDESAKDLDRELREIPERIQEMRTDMQRLEAMLGKEREQLSDAESLGRSHEEQLSSSNDMLARAKAKSAKSRNAREAEAAEREMEAVRRTIRDREEERGRLSSALERVRESLQQHEKELEELRAMVQEEEAKGQARVAELEAERGRVLAGREELMAQLPKALGRKYDRIRTKKATAVAEVVEGTCRGCRMQLPPQQYIEIQRSEDIQQCPQCHRILYYKPVIED